MKKRLYINDFLLNLIVVLVCITIPLVMFLCSANNEKTLVVSYDGKEEKRISLDSDETFYVHGVEIEVKDGQAYVVNSNCPDKLCVNMKKAKNAGDSIICVPNKVSVRIAGANKTGEADIVAG